MTRARSKLMIMNTLLKRGARILSQNGYVSEKFRDFTLAITCELSEANGTPDDLLIQSEANKTRDEC